MGTGAVRDHWSPGRRPAPPPAHAGVDTGRDPTRLLDARYNKDPGPAYPLVEIEPDTHRISSAHKGSSPHHSLRSQGSHPGSGSAHRPPAGPSDDRRRQPVELLAELGDPPQRLRVVGGRQPPDEVVGLLPYPPGQLGDRVGRGGGRRGPAGGGARGGRYRGPDGGAHGRRDGRSGGGACGGRPGGGTRGGRPGGGARGRCSGGGACGGCSRRRTRGGRFRRGAYGRRSPRGACGGPRTRRPGGSRSAGHEGSHAGRHGGPSGGHRGRARGGSRERPHTGHRERPRTGHHGRPLTGHRGGPRGRCHARRSGRYGRQHRGTPAQADAVGVLAALLPAESAGGLTGRGGGQPAPAGLAGAARGGASLRRGRHE